MKSEKELKDRYEKLKWLISEGGEVYVPAVKRIEVKREIYFLETILGIKHECDELLK
jgi:hypothetical protein